MATFLDFGLLNFFLPAFTFLFILVLMYAILHKTSWFGNKEGLKWIASLSIAAIATLAGKPKELINFMTPWFVVIFVFLIFMFMILIFLGTKEEEAWNTVGGKTLYFIIAVLIVVIGISQVYEGVFSPYNPEQGQTIGGETLRTIFHPRVLGSIFLLVVVAWTIRNVSMHVEGA
ncbi:hypothetical protein HYT51_01650 [Candidatus Woesearchaeota archaeon]|nr:hypothetical protein [Candidatus Woesearchaeota archaeon]